MKPNPQVQRRRVVQIGAAIAAAIIATVGLTMPAWAHVEAELGEVSSSGQAEITFGFHHGCEGLATTALRIQVPTGVSDITVEPTEGFTTNSSETEFGWSGGSVPDGESASFTITAQVSGQAGDTIAFPTIQQCGAVDIAWVGGPAHGEDELEHPAPSIVLAATYGNADDPDAGGGATATASTAPSGLVTTTTLSDTATPETSESNTSGLIVFLVIVVILIGGALYLFLSNRSPRPPAGGPDHPSEPSEAGEPGEPGALSD